MIDQEYFWEDLLQFIDEGTVIPVIGSELYTIDTPDGPIPLLHRAGTLLAESLRVPRNRLPPNATLDQVVLAYLNQSGSRREFMYRRMRTILAETAWPTPEPLRQLAGITAFKLFVTTTIDGLLEAALDQVRFGGQNKTASVAYTLSDIRDLPAEAATLTGPLVYHLFGRVSSQPDYVLTEEDTIEFIHALQSESRRPNLLFDELKAHHLLLLGNNYPDWLTRFLLRTVRNERLTIPGDREAILAGEALTRDRDLVTFLTSPLSYGTKVFETGGAVEFVAELSARWLELHPAPAGQSPTGLSEPGPLDLPPGQEDGPDLAPGGVFLSYASQDVEIVEQAKLTLEAAGLDVWFDKRRLEPGDDYDQKIKRHIRRCAIFCPFISQSTEQRLEGYFRREWRYALDRALNIDQSIPFILPVVIDRTDPYASRTPEEFRRLQWTRLDTGCLPDNFLRIVIGLVRDYRKRERGLA